MRISLYDLYGAEAALIAMAQRGRIFMKYGLEPASARTLNMDRAVQAAKPMQQSFVDAIRIIICQHNFGANATAAQIAQGRRTNPTPLIKAERELAGKVDPKRLGPVQ